MQRLLDEGLITEGSYLEFLHSHTNVVAQPDFDDRRYYGLNPYALGFTMMKDIERICVDPTEEDRHWFPDIAGNGDPMETLKDIWANYRDESFVSQFLSPQVIRKMGLFLVVDDHREKDLNVGAIGLMPLKTRSAPRGIGPPGEPFFSRPPYHHRSPGVRTLNLILPTAIL